MKTSQIVSTFVILLSTTPAFAKITADGPDRFEDRETIVHATKHLVDVDLNTKTVLCSRADYSQPMLKVLIPGLAGVTLLDHENTGAGAPCVTTGESCLGGGGGAPRAKPEDILQGRPGIEKVEVIVTEKRLETLDHVAETCTVLLIETVETEIRGKKLFHQRENSLASRNYESCLNGGK